MDKILDVERSNPYIREREVNKLCGRRLNKISTSGLGSNSQYLDNDFFDELCWCNTNTMNFWWR